jgi:hypothetical protein
LDLFPWAATTDFQQSINDRVEIDFRLICHGRRVSSKGRGRKGGRVETKEKFIGELEGSVARMSRSVSVTRNQFRVQAAANVLRISLTKTTTTRIC